MVSSYILLYYLCFKSYLYLHVTIHIFDICHSNKYDCHIANMTHTAMRLIRDRDPTVFCMYLPKYSQLKQLLHALLPNMCQKQICPCNATYMLHMPISSCADIRQLCQYIYLISAYQNQKCHHKHWFTYISYYWHMTLNKYA